MIGHAVLALSVAALWFSFLAPISLGGPVSLIWVSGTSMEPTLHTGDLSIMYERRSYDPGDLVAFEIPEGGTVIHRVIRETNDGYQFRGDNRNRDDPWTLDGEAIRGRQLFHIPQAARIMTFLGRPLSLGGLMAVLVFIGLFRQEENDAHLLGPGYLTWGVVGGSPGRLLPSVGRARRTRRARRHLANYRRDLADFQQWPTRTSRG
jgi:signal peptidase I